MSTYPVVWNIHPVDKLANDFANLWFAATGEYKEEIYPAAVSEIAANQCNDKTFKRYFENNVEVDQY